MTNKGWHSPLLFLRRSPRAALPCLLLLVPAFLSGCRSDISYDIGYVLTDIEIRGFTGAKAVIADGAAIKSLDLFVFDDDRLGKLDSYERIDNYIGGSVRVLSTTGEKYLVAVANLPEQTLRTSSISCMEDIKHLTIRFEDNDEDFPIMSSATGFSAGNGEIYGITLEPVCCWITLSGIEPDDGLTDIKVHLENLAASCRLFPDNGARPAEFIEKGPEVEYYPGISLCCFPNGTVQESLGSYFTELVIEGMKDGEKRVYRIKVNEGNGLERNARYHLSVGIGGSEDENVIRTGSMVLYPGNFITGRDGEYIRIWVEVDPPDTEVLFDEEDLRFDKERGIYDYVHDPDGKGVTLHLLRGGTGMFCIDAGTPVNDGCLVVIVCNP